METNVYVYLHSSFNRDKMTVYATQIAELLKKG